MTIPSGIDKKVIIAKQSGLGVTAANNTGKVLRRVSAAINLTKQTYESAEKRDDHQVVDFRHGTRGVTGNVEGELSCFSYKDLLAAALRGAWAAGATSGAVTVIAAADDGTFTRSTGSFITNGFKVGDLIAVTGFTSAENNGKFLVTDVSATVLTVDSAAMVDEAEGDTVTIAVDGYKLMVPSTGHTKDYFTLEQLYELDSSDVSELATDCVVSTASLNIQPNAMATVSFGLMGRQMTSDTSAYFSSPTVAGSNGVMSGPQGALYLGGSAIAVVTGLSIDIDESASSGAVIGSDLAPDIFRDRLRVTGSMSAYFLNNQLWSAFEAEDELSLVLRLNAGVDEVMVIKLPRIKLGGTEKDDPDGSGIIQTVPFTALKYVGTGPYEGSTIVIQDSEVSS